MTREFLWLLVAVCIQQMKKTCAEDLSDLCKRENEVENPNGRNAYEGDCYALKGSAQVEVTWEQAFTFCYCNPMYGKYPGYLSTYDDMIANLLTIIYQHLSGTMVEDQIIGFGVRYDESDGKWYWVKPGAQRREVIEKFWRKGAKEEPGFATSNRVAGFGKKQGEYALNSLPEDKLTVFMCRHQNVKENAEEEATTTTPDPAVNYGFALDLLDCSTNGQQKNFTVEEFIGNAHGNLSGPVQYHRSCSCSEKLCPLLLSLCTVLTIAFSSSKLLF